MQLSFCCPRCAYMNSKRQKELKKLVSGRISAILDKKGWKPQVLADKLEKDKGYISRILHGAQNMTLDTIAEIEEILEEKIIKI